MRLSENANNLFLDFFDECDRCDPAELPDVQIYAKRGSWLLTNLFFVDGITLGRHVFVNPKLARRDDENLLRVSKSLIVHELVHVMQYQRLGHWKFLRVYVSDFWVIFRRKKKWNPGAWFEAYLEIPHEIEAREVASEFSQWFELEKTIEADFSRVPR